jgi:PAS domain S-box-containing protein
MQGRAVTWAAALGVGVLYFLAGKLGLAFAIVHTNATAVWPPAGIALAAILLLGRDVWPAIFAGAFLVNYSTAGSIVSSLGIATGNTLEALVGAFLVERFANGAAAFDRAQDIFKFVVAALLSTMMDATLSVSTLALTGHARWAEFGPIWLTWWLGDAAGDLVVAPFLLLAVRGKAPGAIGARDRPLEALLLGGVSVGLALAVFRDIITNPAHYHLTFLCLPPLLWSAFRFGARETSALILLIGGIAVGGTSAGLGAFAVASPNAALLLLQLFLGTMAATSLSIAALIWESRGVERALRERDERLRLALEAGGLGTWEWTLPTGRIVWSPSLEAIHGLPTRTFGGTFDAFEAIVHHEDRERLRAAIRAALQRGEDTTEYRVVRPDGSVRWLEAHAVAFYDAAGRPDRLVGVCADVTEDKRSDVRVAFLGEIARSITSSLDLDTVLRRVVEGAQALTGSDSSAIMLRDAESGAMVPRHRVGSWWRDWDTLRVTPGRGLGGVAMVTGRPVRTDDYRADPRVPSEFRALTVEAGTMALMVVPILVGAEPAGLLYIANRAPRSFTDEDETICVRLAEQTAVAVQNARLFGRQEAARAEAEGANRTKDEFLAMLGHELRNPLGAISSAAHVLSRTAAGNNATTRASEIISRQVQHLARIVDDLLDVSRVVAGKVALRLQPVDLGEIGRRVATLHGGPAGSRHVITVQAASTWVSADPTRLEQVLTNLLANAVKYTPPGGEITVTVQRDGDHAVLSVRDTGVGIRPELLPRVFDLFVQADRSLERSAGGLGIGLTLVRQLVQLHGGTVEASSAGPGRGSTFTVRLPILADLPDADDAARPAVAGPARRVLVVEDNEDAREMLRNLLHILGHEVHEACDGASGIEEARRVRPDAALIDIGLPGIDGYEVARRIRAEVPGARLVAVTGYGQPEDRERALAAGFDVHLVKPVDLDQLQRLLTARAGVSGSL